MKLNIKRIIIIIMLLITWIIIFKFSSQSGEESSNVSRGIIQKIIDFIPNIGENQELAERVIRKIAHFSIYTLVGLLLKNLFNTYDIKEKYKIIYSLIIGIIYAISDEIHQKFVPGRSAQITDVMLDSMGVALGILLVMLVIEIIKKTKKHKKSQKNLKKKCIMI